MSDGQRIGAREARARAEVLKRELEPLCKQIELAGSLRRGKPDVGDVEIVALPQDAPSMLARLDKLVAAGSIHKARYSDGKTRWGQKYRGLIIDGLRVEVFLADVHNWGFILWLRTGPGDANEWVMRQCLYQRAPYRAVEGYWRVTLEGGEPGPKIHVPDEKEMFRLLGIKILISPGSRRLETYAKLMHQVTWAQNVTVVDEPPPSTQTALF